MSPASRDARVPAGMDRAALLQATAIAFAGGFVAGSLAFLYLRGLEKKAEARKP